VTALFKISTTARLTGIDAATLRNWEQRYGVVVAARGPGGQRAYSLADVDRLRWLKGRIAAGLSPVEAHAMLRERLKAGTVDFTSARLQEESRRLRALAAETRAAARRARGGREESDTGL
jgi:DNA-binding transcriptional MerR regulator